MREDKRVRLSFILQDIEGGIEKIMKRLDQLEKTVKKLGKAPVKAPVKRDYSK